MYFVSWCMLHIPASKKKKSESDGPVLVACTFWTPCSLLSHRPSFCYIIWYDVRNFCCNTLFKQLANASVWANISPPNQRASEFCLKKHAVLWQFCFVCTFVLFSRTFLYHHVPFFVACCFIIFIYSFFVFPSALQEGYLMSRNMMSRNMNANKVILSYYKTSILYMVTCKILITFRKELG
jgi:hypothetical protein